MPVISRFIIMQSQVLDTYKAVRILSAPCAGFAVEGLFHGASSYGACGRVRRLPRIVIKSLPSLCLLAAKLYAVIHAVLHNAAVHHLRPVRYFDD